VHTVANGCDTRIFRPRLRSEARAILGVPRDVRLIVFVGRMTPAKGVRELLAAWRSLVERDPAVYLAIVGDGALRDELKRAAGESEAGRRVLLPGAVPAAVVASWMQASDVVCLPSHTEGYPNVLVEALACGRPVVATPVGGVLEIVDESSGILTPLADAGALARSLRVALDRAWDETALSRRFGRSWADVARETLEVCQLALGEASSQSEHPAEVTR
jgi:glycosyltransferase involved in cell wall biosynthesis